MHFPVKDCSLTVGSLLNEYSMPKSDKNIKMKYVISRNIWTQWRVWTRNITREHDKFRNKTEIKFLKIYLCYFCYYTLQKYGGIILFVDESNSS